ncbi:hypothetical protein FRB93_004554 [Tulasnella sp. JGI-2019a]|nr:hypothetical protein FRB93_004554 [Tulasnella sp. JGI-2019a]
MVVVVVQTPSSSPITAKSRTLSDWPSTSSDTEPLLAPPPYNPEPDRSNMRPPGSAGWRFIKAFMAAVAIYAVFGLLIRLLSKSGHIIIEGPEAGPRKGDGDTVQCHLPLTTSDSPAGAFPWVLPTTNLSAPEESSSIRPALFTADPPFIAGTSLTLSLEQIRLLYFLSKGSFSRGTIRFVTSYLEPPPDIAHEPLGAIVDISVRYWSNQARGKVNICLLRKEEGAYGVGIYTPARWPVNDFERLSFNVTVTLPASTLRKLSLTALMTDMLNFSHDLDDLADQVRFESVNLKSSNMPMRIKSIMAQDFEAKTTNAPITGNFNATHRLALTTTNAPIYAQIGATNEDWHKPTDVILKTSHAIISTNIWLNPTNKRAKEPAGVTTRTSRWNLKEVLRNRGWDWNIYLCRFTWMRCNVNHRVTPHDSEGGFNIQTTSRNGALKAAVLSAPVGAHINFKGVTSNSDAQLTLPPAFEGTIKASTSNFPVKLDESPHADDPAKLGRKRALRWTAVGTRAITLMTWWGEEKDPREHGEASLTTSNGPATIILGA